MLLKLLSPCKGFKLDDGRLSKGLSIFSPTWPELDALEKVIALTLWYLFTTG